MKKLCKFFVYKTQTYFILGCRLFYLCLFIPFDRSVVSPGTLVSSSNKTDHHNITEILLKVVLKHHNPNPLSPSPPDIKTLDIKNLCRTWEINITFLILSCKWSISWPCSVTSRLVLLVSYVPLHNICH